MQRHAKGPVARAEREIAAAYGPEAGVGTWVRACALERGMEVRIRDAYSWERVPNALTFAEGTLPFTVRADRQAAAQGRRGRCAPGRGRRGTQRPARAGGSAGIRSTITPTPDGLEPWMTGGRYGLWT